MRLLSRIVVAAVIGALFGVIGGWAGALLMTTNSHDATPIDAAPVVDDPYTGLPTKLDEVVPAVSFYDPDLAGQSIVVSAKGVSLFYKRSSGNGNPSVLGRDGVPLSPGEALDIVGRRFVDFGVGTSYVEVRRGADHSEGFIRLDEFIAGTLPVGANIDELSVGGTKVPAPIPVSPQTLLNATRGKSFSDTLNAGHPGMVHPVHAASMVLTSIGWAASDEAADPGRANNLDEVKRFFREYAIPSAVRFGDNAVAWPYPFAFPIAWGIPLDPPWYSGYANAVMALNAALLFRATGDQQYKTLAEEAVNWLRISTTEGGPLYRIGNFDFIAEYAYKSPPLPNIRVLDGEMISVISLYDTAILLDDRDMLRFASRLIYGLSTQLGTFTTVDNRIQNSRYEWLVDNAGYVDAMKRWARILWSISKDRRFLAASDNWHQSDVFWPKSP